MNKTLLSSLLVTGMLMGAAVPAFAADGKEFGSELQIDAKATTVNITVPGTAPMIFNDDGTNTLPSDFTVSNNSQIGGVYLSEIALDAEESGWSLLAESADLKTQAKDLKKIKLKMGKEGTMKLIAPTNSTDDSTGTATFASGEIDIPAAGSQKLNFDVERGTFTEDIPNAKAFGMTLTFKFK